MARACIHDCTDSDTLSDAGSGLSDRTLTDDEEFRWERDNGASHDHFYPPSALMSRICGYLRLSPHADCGALRAALKARHTASVFLLRNTLNQITAHLKQVYELLSDYSLQDAHIGYRPNLMSDALQTHAAVEGLWREALSELEEATGVLGMREAGSIRDVPLESLDVLHACLDYLAAVESDGLDAIVHAYAQARPHYWAEIINTMWE